MTVGHGQDAGTGQTRSGSERAGDALAAALEREHHEIDAGIEAFLASGADDRDRTNALTRAVAALRRHIYLEEAFLFPPLRDAGLVAPVFVMLREHGEIWNTMDALDTQLSDDTGSRSGGESCRELLAQLERHNAKEEAIIYPQADTVLSADAAASLRAFLSCGQTPEGWACQQAGAEPA